MVLCVYLLGKTGHAMRSQFTCVKGGSSGNLSAEAPGSAMVSQAERTGIELA
jgi:hypothetical protein